VFNKRGGHHLAGPLATVLASYCSDRVRRRDVVRTLNEIAEGVMGLAEPEAGDHLLTFMEVCLSLLS
jgi:hypothetical protein